MERPRSGTERTPCCRRAHRRQRADHATSRIGPETAPNRLSRLLPHRGFRLGTEGLSRAEPEVAIQFPPAKSLQTFGPWVANALDLRNREMRPRLLRWVNC
jgi:hypothetical protein